MRAVWGRKRRRARTSGHRKAAGRSGFFSLELALTLPILGLVLAAIFEFSMLLSARAAVVEASRVGARRAAQPACSVADVQREVCRVLPARLRPGLAVEVHLGRKPGDVVAVRVSVPMKNAAPDLLWPAGYSLKNRRLLAETRLLKQ